VTAIDPADLVYDVSVACCGRVWRIPRTLALAKRLEQHCGPLFPLASRLRVLQVTIPEIARIILALLEGQRDVPVVGAVEVWLFRRGLTALAPTLATDVLSLIAGNDAVAEKLKAASEARPAEDAQGPFGRTAA
jgi:hypothetical protein